MKVPMCGKCSGIVIYKIAQWVSKICSRSSRVQADVPLEDPVWFRLGRFMHSFEMRCSIFDEVVLADC